MQQQLAQIARIFALSGITLGQRIERLLRAGLDIQSFLQDGFHRAVAWIMEPGRRCGRARADRPLPGAERRTFSPAPGCPERRAGYAGPGR